MVLVTQAAYAKHCGVSQPRITRWKARGTVVMVGSKVDQEASDALRASLPPAYRGGEVGGSRSAAAKERDASTAAEAGANQLAPATVTGRDGEVFKSEDEWETEMLRQAIDRLKATGAKSCSVKEFAKTCNVILREWERGET